MSAQNILNPDYSLFSVSEFFGQNNINRKIILFYVLSSLLLNFIIQIGICFLNKKSISHLGIITSCIVIVNFIHTFSYSYEWVTKSKKTGLVQIVNEKDDKEKLTIGGLLIGNLHEYSICHLQSFFLIFTSISQDLLFIILLYMVTSCFSKEQNLKKIAKNLVIYLGFLFPFILSLFLLFSDALGINDEYCYLKKFDFIEDKIDNLVSYSKYKHYDVFSNIINIIHIINFLVTLFFILKISFFIFIKKNKKEEDKEDGKEEKERYINFLLSALSLPLIQLFTKIIGIIYYFLEHFYSDKIRKTFSTGYLILNTIDSILIPLVMIIDGEMYTFFCCWRKKKYVKVGNKSGSLLFDGIEDFQAAVEPDE